MGYGDDTMRRLGMIAALFCAIAATAAHAERGVIRRPDGRPVISAVRAPAPPVLDGVLDDSVWRAAVELDDFYIPNLDRYPTERTIIWLAYDDSCIYWAARMFDREPGTLRMDQTKRGGSVTRDDHITVDFDIDNRHSEHGDHAFSVTPRGTQTADFPDGATAKVEWRGDWRAVARIDSLGWTVEVAIPARIFDRPGGARTVGISATRSIPRTQEEIRWPNLGRTWDPTKCGDWEGVVFPPQHVRPQIMPYIVGEGLREDVDDDGDGTIDRHRIERNGYLGADIKWTSPNGMKIAGTIYPDFRNIERDVLDLDFSYTELQRGDNRPFFAENADYFPDPWIFYSNRVGEVYGGVKTVGTVGTKHRIGIIEAYDRDKVNHLAGKWYWQPRERVEAYSHFAYRHGPIGSVTRPGFPQTGDNLMVVSEASYEKTGRRGTDYFNIQGGFSQASDTGGTGYDIELRHSREPANANFGWSIQGRILSPDFLSIDGLLERTDADQREIHGWIGYEREYDRLLFRDWEIYLEGRHSDRFDGSLYQSVVDLELKATFYRGFDTTIDVRRRDRPPFEDQTALIAFGWLQDRLHGGGWAGATFGTVGDADYLLLELHQRFPSTENLTGSLDAQYRRRDFPPGHAADSTGGVQRRHQLVGTLQYDLTTERAISGRVIAARDGMNGYLTFQQVVRRGMDLFLILGDPSADTWSGRVALKAVFVL